MSSSKERNTELFYKELEKEDCDPDYLLELSQKGIFLIKPLFEYESIKYHENVVDISLISQQFFIIFNDKQYERFMQISFTDKYQKYVILGTYHMYIYDLLIINKFFINKLLEESRRDILVKFIKNINIVFYIYFLYKYNILTDIKIPSSIKDESLRYELYPSILFVLFEDYFYLDGKHNIKNVTKYISEEKLINNIFLVFGRDITVLDYLIQNFDCINDIDCSCFYRMHLNFPMKIISKYSKKIFKPNLLKFKCENKAIENYVNDLYSDKSLDYVKGCNLYLEFHDYFDNIDIKKTPIDYTVENFDKFKEKISIGGYKYNENINFNNKDIFVFENREETKIQEIINLNDYVIKEESDFDDFYYDSEDSCYYIDIKNENEKEENNEPDNRLLKINEILTYEYDSLSEFYENFYESMSCLLFYYLILCDNDRVEKILKDPNYILHLKIEELIEDPNHYYNSEFDKTSQYNFEIMKNICYIASLVYNKAPDFVIHLLCYELNPTFVEYKDNKINIVYFCNHEFISPRFLSDNFYIYALIQIIINRTSNEIFNNLFITFKKDLLFHKIADDYVKDILETCSIYHIIRKI